MASICLRDIKSHEKSTRRSTFKNCHSFALLMNEKNIVAEIETLLLKTHSCATPRSFLKKNTKSTFTA